MGGGTVYLCLLSHQDKKRSLCRFMWAEYVSECVQCLVTEGRAHSQSSKWEGTYCFVRSRLCVFKGHGSFMCVMWSLTFSIAISFMMTPNGTFAKICFFQKLRQTIGGLIWRVSHHLTSPAHSKTQMHILYIHTHTVARIKSVPVIVQDRVL